MIKSIIVNVNKKELKELKIMDEIVVAVNVGWLRSYNVGFAIPKNIDKNKETDVIFIKEFEDIFKNKKIKYMNYQKAQNSKTKETIMGFFLELDDRLNKDEIEKIVKYFGN